MARSTIRNSEPARTRSPRTPLRVPTGELSEQIGSLLSRLYAMGSVAGGQLRAVGVTSSNRREGVTTIACKLALRAAISQDLRVLLVDANQESPNLHRVFGLRKSPGLADLFSGVADERDCLHDMSRVPLEAWPKRLRKSILKDQGIPRSNSRLREELLPPQISIIPAGTGSQLPGRFSIENEDFFERASSLYDLVFVDLPAVSSATNCGFPLSILDGVLFVVKAESTSDIAARKSLNQLKHDGANVLGAVLNQHRTHLPKWIDRRLGD